MAISTIGLSTHIWNNRIRSGMLLVLFPLIICLVSWLGLWLYAIENQRDALYFANTNLKEFLPYIIGGCGVWLVVSFFLHERMIAAMSDAETIAPAGYPELKRLLENLCIQRGIPTPKLAIIYSPALNAFASGIRQGHYTITVTEGLVKALDDAEMEAVLAHELTHIINGDVKLMMVAAVFASMFSTLMELAGRRRGKISRETGKAQMALWLATALGSVMAMLTRLALSRTRELMADAGAVELTKNGGALVSALNKIACKPTVPHLPGELRAMCFHNTASFVSLFSTHPAVPERVALIKRMGGTVEHVSTKPYVEVCEIPQKQFLKLNLKEMMQSGEASNKALIWRPLPFSQQKGALLTACVFLLAACGILYGSYRMWQNDTRFVNEGITTNASVTERYITTSRDNDGRTTTHYNLRYTFYADDNSEIYGHGTVSKAVYDVAEIGFPLGVSYLRSEPNENRIGGTQRRHTTWMVALFGLVFVGVVVYLLRDIKQRAENYDLLLMEGVRTTGRYAGTQSRTTGNKRKSIEYYTLFSFVADGGGKHYAVMGPFPNPVAAEGQALRQPQVAYMKNNPDIAMIVGGGKS